MLQPVAMILLLGAGDTISPRWTRGPADNSYEVSLRGLAEAEVAVSVVAELTEVSERDLTAKLQERLSKVGIKLLNFDPANDRARFILAVSGALPKDDGNAALHLDLYLSEPVLIRRGTEERLSWQPTWRASTVTLSKRGKATTELVNRVVSALLGILEEQYRRSQR